MSRNPSQGSAQEEASQNATDVRDVGRISIIGIEVVINGMCERSRARAREMGNDAVLKF